MLTALWNFFHYSPKRAESIEMVQQVLDLPKLKIVKPSDIYWLAHERCVKAVKAIYGAIVMSQKHLVLAKLSLSGTLAAMYMLDYILPQVAKLSRTLQTLD